MAIAPSEVDQAYINRMSRLGDVEVAKILDRIPPDRKEFFIYQTEKSGLVLPATIGSQVSTSLSIGSEADFIVTKLTAIDDSPNIETPLHWGLQIVLGSSDRGWMNTSIHNRLLTGTGSLPGILPFPRIIPRSSLLSLLIERLSAGTQSNLIWIAFVGYKVYYDLANLNLTARRM